MDINDIFGAFDGMDQADAQAEIDAFAGSMDGDAIDGGTLAMMAGFANLAVEAAMAELAAMARHLGTDSVPLPVLKEYAKHQSVAATILWEMAELSGAEIRVVTNVPDDLSELDGEL